MAAAPTAIATIQPWHDEARIFLAPLTPHHSNLLSRYSGVVGPVSKGELNVKHGIWNGWLAISSVALVFIAGCVTSPEEQLREAAAEGNALRVQTLLERGVTAQAADERGITPLFMAAKNGHRNVITLLLEHGAAMNPTRQDGVTPFFVAVQEGRLDVVALFLEKGADVNAQARIGGVTPLHIGAYKGDQAIVTFLLEHGADKNARMTSGERPVDLAQSQGHTALIPLLEP